ncbi:MAG TPA: hypothetical protein VGQ51_06590 [Puia sp.]|nr:hypothetical protein [Puia sp.]
MLKGITWVQFSIFILVAASLYYLYVAAVFYRAGVLRTRRKGEPAPGQNTREETIRKENGAEEATTRLPAKSQEEAPGRVGQGGMEGKAALPRNVKEKEAVAATDDLPQLALKAIATIRQVIAQGTENKHDRQNVMDHIGEVLTDYRKLRRTEHAETINNFLIRVCASDLSLHLSEKELAELWK